MTHTKELQVILLPTKEKTPLIRCIDVPHHNWAHMKKGELGYSKNPSEVSDLWEHLKTYWVDPTTPTKQGDLCYSPSQNIIGLNGVSFDLLNKRVIACDDATYNSSGFCIPRISEEDIKNYVAAPYDTVMIKMDEMKKVWDATPNSFGGQEITYTPKLIDGCVVRAKPWVNPTSINEDLHNAGVNLPKEYDAPLGDTFKKLGEIMNPHLNDDNPVYKALFTDRDVDDTDEAWKFAQWLDSVRNKNDQTGLYRDTNIWGKTTAYELMYREFKKWQSRPGTIYISKANGQIYECTTPCRIPCDVDLADYQKENETDKFSVFSLKR